MLFADAEGQFLLDRDKVLAWWTGRITDANLAEWTGMPSRAVTLILNEPYMRSGVSGGGKGSRHVRRISQQIRNAVPIIHSLNEGGLHFGLATNLIAATPVIASLPTEIIDWFDPMAGVRSMAVVDPNGNWLPDDVVPAHVWNRFVYPCHKLETLSPQPGNMLQVLPWLFKPDDRGIMFVDRSAMDLPNIEIKSLTKEPVYSGEIDPIGLYEYDRYDPEALPQFDHHLLVVNGRWVFIKSPDPSPSETMHNMWNGVFANVGEVKFRVEPISVIEHDKKTVRVIGWGEDDWEQQRARYYLDNFDSILDVNLTLAVRKMKRRAYGLPVGKPETPVPFEERVKIAQRYPPPESFR